MHIGGARLNEVMEIIEILCESKCLSRCVNGSDSTIGELEELKSEVEKAISNGSSKECLPVERSLMYKLLMLLETLKP